MPVCVCVCVCVCVSSPEVLSNTLQCLLLVGPLSPHSPLLPYPSCAHTHTHTRIITQTYTPYIHISSTHLTHTQSHSPYMHTLHKHLKHAPYISTSLTHLTHAHTEVASDIG